MQREYNTDEQKRKFYNSVEWRSKRDETLKNYNHECAWCKKDGGVTTKDHAILEVDHIYELEHYPRLALVDDNLRVLCNMHHNMRHKRFKFAPTKKSKWEDERW